jgi:hypothetical protein
MKAPAVYLGTLPGFRQQPPIELYNLLDQVGLHPAGSTVSRQTLEDHGLVPPAVGTPLPNQPTNQEKRS